MTEGGDLNTARGSLAGSGTSTLALGIGGDAPPHVANVESWNGSSWTEVSDLNTAREDLAASKQNTISTLAFGGTSPARALTEDWNGNNWTEVGDLNTARDLLAGAGATGNTAALAFGGETSPGVSNLTEDWSGSSLTSKVLTD